MKSEKKSSNDLSCVPNGIVKEEPGVDPGKITAAEKGSRVGNNSEAHESGEANNSGVKNPDDKGARNQKINTNNQQTLNPVKVENNSSYPACNLSNDCGGASAPKSDANGLGKCGRNGAGGGESQFMQQQSHIFVFSTMLANKGAEAVLRGQFPSIVAYHCAQPGTKKFLEKHPNKGNKFGQSPAEWLNNFGASTASQKNQQTCPNNFPRRTPELPVLDPDPPSFWNEQSNVRNSNIEKPVGNTESSVDDTINKVVNSQPSPNSLGEAGCSISGGPQPSLQGVKVPDENLTPQQRQHREEQLATIRKMQILLFSNRKEEAEGSTAPNMGGQTSQSFVPGGSGGSPSDNSLENFSSGVDWDKIENQLFDPKDKVTSAENSTTSAASAQASNSRGQGPPPPYHQSSRPASVPAAALQSSNPSSPNNPTSTLSLPSPRANSGLNSPADCGRFHSGTGQRSAGYLGSVGSPMTQDSMNSVVPSGIENSSNRSNPGTPASHSHLVAFSPAPPSATQKDSIDFASGQSPSVEDIFCQTLQSVGQEQRDQAAKEANLMPVPSPQQIQYLNTFEGQELTIQKQPNTSLKEGGTTLNASSVPSSGLRILSEGGSGQCGSISMSGGSPMTDNGDRGFAAPLPSPRTPRTPTHSGFDSTTTTTTGGRMSSGQNSPASYGQSLSRGLPESPIPVKDASPSTGKNKQQLLQHHQNEGSKIAQEFCGRQSTGSRGQLQHDNLPLNPNNVNNCLRGQGAASGSHFDPITSLAQMSQQLASLAPASGMGDGGMMQQQQQQHPGNPGPLQEMSTAVGEFGDPGFPSGFGNCMPCTSYGAPPRPQNLQGIPSRAPSHSPMGFAAMHPAAAYHGQEPRGPPRTNVQVKPGAPNTIQYLPAVKPSQCNTGGPRPPPSLDFLQGFANSVPNQRFFPGNPQGGYPGIGRPQRPPSNFHPGGYNNPQIMRAPPVNNPAMRMQHMVGGGVFPGNKPFPGDMGPQMSGQLAPRMQYMPAAINQPGMPQPMRSRGPAQPMHSSMETVSGFKNGPFGPAPAGPPTSDPNYAQQYHNFQQQLYATGTRANVPQHSGHHLGTNSPSFLPER